MITGAEQRYIKVEWPQSQIFQVDKYEDSCYWCDDMVCFVPEELFYDYFNGHIKDDN